MGKQGGGYKTDRKCCNHSSQYSDVGPSRGSPERDPRFVNEPVREKENGLNDGNEYGNSGSQAGTPLAANLRLAFKNWMIGAPVRLLSKTPRQDYPHTAARWGTRNSPGSRCKDGSLLPHQWPSFWVPRCNQFTCPRF
jgi:hypothetical protein